MSSANGSQRVRLGRMAKDGVAPSIFGLLERGIARRPEIAAEIRGRVVIRFAEEFSPLRITFRPKTVVLEDGDLRKPDLVIAGTMPDIVHLLTVPMLGGPLAGLPNPAKPRGREALSRIASGRVKMDGDTGFGLKLLQLLAV
jgi:hypothetical protein